MPVRRGRSLFDLPRRTHVAVSHPRGIRKTKRGDAILQCRRHCARTSPAQPRDTPCGHCADRGLGQPPVHQPIGPSGRPSRTRSTTKIKVNNKDQGQQQRSRSTTKIKVKVKSIGPTTRAGGPQAHPSPQPQGSPEVPPHPLLYPSEPTQGPATRSTADPHDRSKSGRGGTASSTDRNRGATT